MAVQLEQLAFFRNCRRNARQVGQSDHNTDKLSSPAGITAAARLAA